MNAWDDLNVIHGTESGHPMQSEFPSYVVPNVDGADRTKIGVRIGKRSHPNAHNTGHWVARDAYAARCGIGISIEGSQFGDAKHVALHENIIGERIMDHAFETAYGGGNSNKHGDCRYTRNDVGIVMAHNGPWAFGDNSWRDTHAHQCRTFFALLGDRERNDYSATFLGGNSEYCAHQDLSHLVEDIPTCLWYWRGGGPLKIQDWACADKSLENQIILDAPGARLILVDHRGGPATTSDGRPSYVVRALHSEATVELRGALASCGHFQNVIRWPDGYGVMPADWASASALDGYPVFNRISGFANQINPNASWNMSGQSSLYGPLSGIPIGRAPMMFSCLIENESGEPIKLSADISDFSPHEINLKPRQTKRFVGLNSGQHLDRFLKIIGPMDKISIPKESVQFLWGNDRYGDISNALENGWVG